MQTPTRSTTFPARRASSASSGIRSSRFARRRCSPRRFRRRGRDAILVPMHVLPESSTRCCRNCCDCRTWDGLVFTIPFKVRACALADTWATRRASSAPINALARGADGRWRARHLRRAGLRRGVPTTGDLVCRQARDAAGRRRRGVRHRRRGRWRAAGVAAHLRRRRRTRASALARKVAHANPGVDVRGAGTRRSMASTSCSTRRRWACWTTRGAIRRWRRLPRDLVVFDAIVKPERTPLLALAEACGCTTSAAAK